MLSQLEYLQKVLSSRVYDVAENSELVKLTRFSDSMNNEVWLKREDQQPVKSFKLRGAYNRMSQLPAAQRLAGVVAASAGNHAQGVAYAAARMKIPATVVMPQTTPEIKIEAVRRFGGEYVDVVLHGDNFDTAAAKAAELANTRGLVLIPPFDDPDVIAGQGTIGKEIIEKNPQIDTVFVAVGGGGLAAGIATYIKAVRPDIRIIAVEAEDSACLHAARAAGKPVDLPHVGIFADGVAVKRIGEEPFRLCQQYIDDVIVVNSDEICAAIKDIFDDTRVIAEPAGALSIAAIRKFVRQNPGGGRQFAGILCGANINFHTLRYVSERCELGEQKEAVFAVQIPEEKGAFKQFCTVLGDRPITEFNYRYSSEQHAQIFVGTKLHGGLAEFKQLADTLQRHGYPWFDLSGNELAKLHVRYMVGGRPPRPLEEHIFGFEFPEAPGALLRFLDTLGNRWQLTLFHYRNHGAATGSVLAGFDIPQDQQTEFFEHLDKLGYGYQEHTRDPAYRFFLSDVNRGQWQLSTT